MKMRNVSDRILAMLFSGDRKNSVKVWILTAGIFFSALLAILYFKSLQRQEKKDIERIRTIYTERTENLINSVFHKTDVLAAVVKLENGAVSEETFNAVAHLVYQKNSGIRGIQSMPGAIVTYSYPLKGNEQVMGKNFFDIPERRKDVMLAINTKSIALSGPYQLIQGGLGVVARNPVFLKDENGNEYFWGFSAIILDLPDALVSAGLNQLPDAGYDFQLFCINENGERLVIAGNQNLNAKYAVCGTIQVPHHEWTLVITSVHFWISYVKALTVFFLCMLLLTALWKFSSLVFHEKAAVQAKDQFFSNISHDMRTPLNAVLGFTELAKTPELSASEKDVYLEKIESAGNLLLELVNDTLTLSKASNGKIHLQPEPCSTEDIGKYILPPVAELAKQKGIHFIVDRSAYRRRTILIDRLNSEKIFLNLLTNAVKYTPAGGHVWATVRDEPPGAKDADLVFIIKDDGIGMSREFLEHAYEPFAQENRSGYESNGTGLGLAIVKQMVNLMGGTISIISEKDKGTEVTLQLHFPEVDVSAVSVKDVSEVPVADSILCGKRILLCEDNALNREITVALLKRKGITVQTAENGKTGLNAFSSCTEYGFDAILMDIRMPEMDGLETARMIRKLERPDAKTVPIIALSADAFEESIQLAKAAGMNGYLAKPVIPEQLFKELKKEFKNESNS